MNSQASVLEALQKVTSLPKDDLKHEIGILVPVLIGSLETASSQPAVALQATCALFRQCMPCFKAIDEVDKCILSPALPVVKQLLEESLQGISSHLEQHVDKSGTSEVLDSLLQVCSSLLECINCCLQFVRSLSQVECMKLKSVLLNVGDILLLALQHCYDSQQIYGRYIEGLGEIVGVFHRATNDILIKYIDVIKDQAVFDCGYMDQLQLMCQVLKAISRLGYLSTCLGVRAMSETWKLYANLTAKYKEDLQGHLSLEESFENLTSEISTIVQAVVEKGGETKAVERNLKVASFLLRIVIKLCELYPDDLHSCMTSLHQFLLTLHRHSELHLMLSGGTCEHQGLLHRHVVVGAEPLLTQLMTSRNFCKEILTSPPESTDVEPTANLLLLLAIIKQLQGQAPELRRHWFTSKSLGNDIFSSLFSTLDKCPRALSCDVSDETSGKSVGSTLYNSILQSSISLAYGLSDPERMVLEQTLFSTLTSPASTPWTYLVLTDLWVMVIRIAGPSLCLIHLRVLINILQQQDLILLRTIFVSLVQRILNILPAKKRPSVEKIKELSSIKRKVLSNDINKVTETVNNYIYKPNNSTFQELYQTLDMLTYSDPSSMKPLLDTVVKIWHSLDTSHYHGRIIAKKLLKLLSNLTSELKNEQLLIILKSVNNFTSSDLKISVLNFLTCLSKLKFTNDKYQSSVCDNIALLYSILLQDSDDLIQRFALELFVEFGHCTAHEDILPKTVNGSQKLQQMVTNYIKNSQTSNIDKLLMCRQIVVASFDRVSPEEWVRIKSQNNKMNETLERTISPENESFNEQDKEKCESENVNCAEKQEESEMEVCNPFEVVDDSDSETRDEKPPEENVNYLDEHIQELIKQIDCNADTLLSLFKQSVVSTEALLDIKKIVDKLKILSENA